MSDCNYCNLRVYPDDEGKESPHKYGCPGLVIERLQAEIERLIALTEAGAKEIGSYREGTGLRGENRELGAEIERLQAALYLKDERISAWKKSSDEHEAEVERLTEALENERARGIHSCHSECQRPMCVMGREIDRLRTALEWIGANTDSPSTALACHTALETDDDRTTDLGQGCE